MSLQVPVAEEVGSEEAGTRMSVTQGVIEDFGFLCGRPKWRGRRS